MAIHTQTKKTKKKKKKKQKTKKTKKNKKTRPNTLHLTPSPWGVQSWFFWFFWFFGFLVSWFFGFLVCVWIAQTLPMGLNFFLCVLKVFGQTAKKTWKNQKNKKFRPMSPARPLPDLAHGSELFFVFSIVVLNVFHVKMLSSQYLSKKCASLKFPPLRPPGQTAKKTTEKPKFI